MGRALDTGPHRWSYALSRANQIQAFVGCDDLEFFVKQRGIWCCTSSHETGDLKEVVLESPRGNVQARVCVLVYFALRHLTPKQRSEVAWQILRAPSRRSLVGLSVTKTPSDNIVAG